MLSVILHEVGHALGMSSSNNSTVNQTADNDYDFNPAFVFAKTLAAEVADGPDNAHLENPDALMTPFIGSGIRRFPSHTDLFSMASAHQYANLDVPRREFYGGTSWNQNSNWSGNAAPGSNDEAYLRVGGGPHQINFTANSAVGTVHIESHTFRFVIGAGQNFTANGAFFVDNGGTLSVLNGTLNATNQLRVGETYGTTAVDGTLTIDTGSRVVASDDSTTAMVVGQAGYGVVTQSGGLLESTKYAYFGNLANSKGTYNLSGGDATFSTSVFVGNHGEGIVNHSGGADATITQDLHIAASADGSGSYVKTGGILTVNRYMFVGNLGDGVFEQSVGTTVGALEISVGRHAGSTGNLKVTGGSLSTDDDLAVGYGGNGVMEMSSLDSANPASVTIGNRLLLALDDDQNPNDMDGSYKQSGGTLRIGTDIWVGSFARGVLRVEGGTVVAGTTAGGTMFLGRSSPGDGTFEAVGGITSVPQTIVVGNLGTGLLKIGGSAVVNAGASRLAAGPRPRAP